MANVLAGCFGRNNPVELLQALEKTTDLFTWVAQVTETNLEYRFPEERVRSARSWTEGVNNGQHSASHRSGTAGASPGL